MDNTIYKLSNKNGVEIEFISYGGKLKSITLPSADKRVDILMGYDTVEGLIKGDKFVGAICGRFANRISGASFSLNGVVYKLDQNEETNSLHGGFDGFYNRLWDVQKTDYKGFSSAYKLSYLSPDGEGGYPGNLKTDIIYALNDENEFVIDVNAETDKLTVVSINVHPYFNLNGIGGGKVFNHELQINSSYFTPFGEHLIPTGEISPLEGTNIDFNKKKRVGDCISNNCSLIRPIGGLDHNFIIDKKKGESGLACVLSEPESGIGVEVYSTNHGMQVYTAMYFDGSDFGKGDLPIQQYNGISLQPQNFPDAVNKDNFPDCTLSPGDIYNEVTSFKFIF